MTNAAFYEKKPDGNTICHLCPHHCRISPGQSGFCRMRENRDGTLMSLNYGLIVSAALDPIEKKPLYHFHPGSKIFSIGSLGCNLRCFFCQNHEISQPSPGLMERVQCRPPQKILSMARQQTGNIGIAFTYNEPTVWFEFMRDTARLANAEGMATAMITNGYMEKEPMAELLPFIDAFNVDLKGFSDSFYVSHAQGHLEPVKERLIQIRNAGKHLEITNLIIPTLNDDPVLFEMMASWIAETLGKETVLHLSRYFPRYHCTLPMTSPGTLKQLQGIALQHLDYVYLGNI